MKVKGLQIKNFTAFEESHINFCDGINIFIGANSTGKTLLLKLIYFVLKSGEDWHKNSSNHLRESELLLSYLMQIFKPDNDEIGRLIMSKKESEKSRIILSYDNSELAFEINKKDPLGVREGVIKWYKESLPKTPSCIFIPSREILSMYEGFIQAYDKRELSFDKTYYDLCKSLGAGRLKNPDPSNAEMIRVFEDILGGKVVLKGNRFYVESKEELLEAHLLAEGHRKLAMLVQLIANGSIEKDTILLWDEPEANLNPKLITEIAGALIELSSLGIQIFLTTHDYLLSGELSRYAEYPVESKTPPIRFFAFSRTGSHEPVTVQSGDTLADIKDNPILDEFAAHYDRERASFYSEFGKSQGSDA